MSMCAEKSNKAGENSRKQDLQGVAEGTVVGTVKQKAEGRGLLALYKCLKEDCSKESAGLFSQGTSNRRQGNVPKLFQGGFRLDIRMNLFMERVVKH